MFKKSFVLVLLLSLLISSAVQAQTFTFFSAAEPNDWEDSQVGQWIQDEFGVTLEIEYIVGDINTKTGLMIASGDFPDLIFANETQDRFVDAESLIPLNELIEEYGVNTKKLYGPIMDKIKKADGNIYFLPRSRANRDLMNPTAGFWIQRAVLAEFDWPVIETVDQYFELIRKYADKYPMINGQETVGIRLLTDGWRAFTIENTPAVIMGSQNDGNVIVDQETYQAKTFVDEDFARDYYQKLNQMYLGGYLDPESFVANYDQYIAALSTGAVLGVAYDQTWQIGPANTTLSEAGLDERMFVCLPVKMTADIKDRYQDPGTLVVRDGIGISVNCKDPVAAFKFLDRLQSEEVQKMLRWGLVGQDYLVDQDGRMYRTKEMRENHQNVNYMYRIGVVGNESRNGFPTAPNWYKYADGNSWDPTGQVEEIRASYTDWDKKVLAAYGKDTYPEMFDQPTISPYGYAWDISIPDGHPAIIANTKLRDLQSEYLAKLVLAETGEYEQVWLEYLKKVERIDLEAYENYLTQKIRERVEAWGQ